MTTAQPFARNSCVKIFFDLYVIRPEPYATKSGERLCLKHRFLEKNNPNSSYYRCNSYNTAAYTRAFTPVLTPDLRAVGIGCYGPFKTSELKVNPNGREIQSYIQLSNVSAERKLSGVDLKAVVARSIERATNKQIEVCIETDVAADSLGYLYRYFKTSTDACQSDTNNTIGLIRADHGIGGTFIHTNDTEAWHGVIHTEVGQISVQEWAHENEDEGIIGFYCKAANPDSVEGRASIPAIEGLYRKSFNKLRDDPNHLAWDREAWYLAQLAWAFTCFVSPTNIVFCGNIMTVPKLLDKIRDAFALIKKSRRLSLPSYSAMHELDSYIDGSLLCINESTGEINIEDPGTVGSLCLAAILVNNPNPDPTLASANDDQMT